MSNDNNMGTLIKNTFPKMNSILNHEIGMISRDEAMALLLQANFNKIFSIIITDVPGIKFYFQLKHNKAEHLNSCYYIEHYSIKLNSDTYVAIMNGDIKPIKAYYSGFVKIDQVML